MHTIPREINSDICRETHVAVVSNFGGKNVEWLRDMRVEEVLEDAGGESSAPHGTVLRNSRSTDLERARRDHEAAMREYQVLSQHM